MSVYVATKILCLLPLSPYYYIHKGETEWRKNIHLEVWLYHTGQYNSLEYQAYKDKFSKISRHCKLYRHDR